MPNPFHDALYWHMRRPENQPKPKTRATHARHTPRKATKRAK